MGPQFALGTPWKRIGIAYLQLGDVMRVPLGTYYFGRLMEEELAVASKKSRYKLSTILGEIAALVIPCGVVCSQVGDVLLLRQ